MGDPERADRLTAALERLQQTENGLVVHATAVIGRTKSALLRLLMEALRHDALLHHRVEQFVLDGIARAPAPLSPGDLNEIWGLLAHNLAVTGEIAACRDELLHLSDRPEFALLIRYLCIEQEKREELLRTLERLRSEVPALV